MGWIVRSVVVTGDACVAAEAGYVGVVVGGVVFGAVRVVAGSVRGTGRRVRDQGQNLLAPSSAALAVVGAFAVSLEI